jgi:hypothetical protein
MIGRPIDLIAWKRVKEVHTFLLKSISSLCVADRDLAYIGLERMPREATHLVLLNLFLFCA